MNVRRHVTLALALAGTLAALAAFGGAAATAGISAGCAPRAGAASAASPPAVALERVAGDFAQPLYVAAPPGDTHRLFVVEKTGRIRIVKDGVLLPEPFLDLSGLVSTSGEQGLLSMAFHPRFAANGRFYVDYTEPRRRHPCGALRRLDVGPRRRRPGHAQGDPSRAPALRQPQRRAAPVRPRRQALRGHGRRWQRRRPAGPGAGPAKPARQAPAHHSGYLTAQGRHLRQGAAQPVALLVRPRHRRPLDRRRGTEPARGDRPPASGSPAGRQPRMERLRGHAGLRPRRRCASSTRTASSGPSSSTRTTSARASPAATSTGGRRSRACAASTSSATSPAGASGRWTGHAHLASDCRGRTAS